MLVIIVVVVVVVVVADNNDIDNYSIPSCTRFKCTRTFWCYCLVFVLTSKHKQSLRNGVTSAKKSTYIRSTYKRECNNKDKHCCCCFCIIIIIIIIIIIRINYNIRRGLQRRRLRADRGLRDLALRLRRVE